MPLGLTLPPTADLANKLERSGNGFDEVGLLYGGHGLSGLGQLPLTGFAVNYFY